MYSFKDFEKLVGHIKYEEMAFILILKDSFFNRLVSLIITRKFFERMNTRQFLQVIIL